MQTPKVSIMTLAHNCQDFLPAAIESIQEQSFSDWELLIIDDCSTDRTPEIARGFANKEKRIKYFRNEEHLGIPQSRNKALKEARGEYIAVLDGDDVWIDEEKLAKQVEFLDTHPAYGAIGTWTKNINRYGHVINKKKLAENDVAIKRMIYLRNQIVNSSALFRSGVAQEVGGYDNGYVYSQDFKLWLAIGTHWKLKNLPIFATGYRYHSDNVSAHKRKKQLEYNIKAMQEFRKSYPLGKFLWILIPLKKLYIRVYPFIRSVVHFQRNLFSR